MPGKKKVLVVDPYSSQRSNPIPKDLTTRTLALRLEKDGTPSTVDEKTRSVEVICSTENPVDIYDYDRWEIVPEILLMSGCQIPESRQIPLLNSHYRGDVSAVFGSCRDLKVEGKQLVGRAVYSEDEEADKAWRKTREGHLTDYSIGYRVLESYYIPEGQRQTIAGQTFDGPLKVATKWKVRELSTCPIGADEMAKARAATSDLSRKTTHTEENGTMNRGLRMYLEGRGLKATATEEEAWRFLNTLDIRTDGNLPAGITEADLVRTPTPAPAGLTAADVQRQAQEIAEQEITRREEIRSMCDHYGFADMARELIEGKKSLDEARAAVMAKHMKEAPNQDGAGFRAEVIRDGRDKFREAAQDALILRSGARLEKPAPGAQDLRGYGLREMAREALRHAGLSTGGDVLSMTGRALTSSDLPAILGNVANKSLILGFEQAGETYDQWVDTSGSLSDFKTADLVRAGETQTLEEIGEDGEYKYDKLGDRKEQVKLATYGKILPITRQALINDDLGALTDIPMKHGEAWARTLGDIVYAVLTANSAMSDGVALFHANHANLGTAGVVSEITIGEMIKLMKLQKDLGGKRRLNLSPQFFLAPASIEGAAEVFFNSIQFVGDTKAGTRANPYAGSKYNRVYESRLDDASLTAFYMAAAKGKTIKLFFLNGVQTPFMEMKNGWNVDGVEFKVRGDAAAKALDWRGLAKNAGQ